MFSIIGVFALTAAAAFGLTEIVRRFLLSGRKAVHPDFFSNRHDLEQAMPFSARLRSASRIDALFVIGDKFINAEHVETQRVARIIVPNPNSESLQQYAAQMGRSEAIATRIKEVTKRAQELRKPIRWSRQFTGYSYLLGDADTDTGWVHIELVLPGVLPQDRPSLTIFRRHYPRLVDAVNRGFEDMWQHHSEPPADPA